MKIKRITSLLSLLALFSLSPNTLAVEQCDLADTAIIATNSVHLNVDSVVTGDVVVNMASPGPVLEAGAEVGMDRSASVNGNVVADSIDIDRDAIVTGTAHYNEITDRGATIASEVSPLSLPVFAPLPPFESAAPGAADVIVDAGTTTLPPGSYGDIFISVGGTLVLTGGQYDIASIQQSNQSGKSGKCSGYPCRSVEFAGPTDLRVAGSIQPGGNFYIGPAAGEPVLASDIIIYVGGTDAIGDSLELLAVNIEKFSTVAANFYVVDGTFRLDRDSAMTGGIIGRDVEIQKRVNLTAANYFDQPPTLDPIDDVSFLVGDPPKTIILTGITSSSWKPQSLTVTAAGGEGLLNDLAVGYVSPQETGTLTLTLEPERFGADSVTVTVTDGCDASTSRSFVATIEAANQPPTANPQEVSTNPTDPVEIVLTGTDPERADLSFSIVGSATLGQVTAPVPIVPPKVEILDRDGIGTGVFFQPPVTSATVTYTPPQSCPPDQTNPDGTCRDSFVFRVADIAGLDDEALVEINSVDSSPPPPGLNAIVADDILVDTTVNAVTSIALSAGAPPSVASLTYAVETLPASAIEDELGNPIEAVPYDLPSPTVVYQAPPTSGTDGFTYSARDTATGNPPCVSPACDTGTVNISIGEAQQLAEDLSLGTPLNTPLQFTLVGNPGGTGDGGGAAPQSEQSTTSPSYTHFYEAQAIESDANVNGAADTRGKKRQSGRGAGSGPQLQAQLALSVDAGWSATSTKPPAFFWGGTVPVFADDSYAVTLGDAGCLSVTDDFTPGDQFRLYDSGNLIGTTPAVATGADVEVGPDAAYLDPDYSSGSFNLAAGSYDIQIELIGASLSGGRGYIRVDSGSCRPNLEVTAFSAPDSASLDEAIGDDIQATVTNTGTTPIPAATTASIGYYVSTDAVITTADRLLIGGHEAFSQQAPGGLAVGESVQIDLFTGAAIGSEFPDLNPPIGNAFIGVLVDEFNDVAETDETDNTASEAIDVIGESTPSLVYTVASLPGAGTGTLTDLSGVAITAGQMFTIAPTLRFTPSSGFFGATSFTYTVTQGTVIDTAVIDILVGADDECVLVGRPPGCTP